MKQQSWHAVLLHESTLSSPEALANDWLKSLAAAGRSVKTGVVSRVALLRWLAFVRAQGYPDDPAAATRAHVTAWVMHERERGKPGSVETYESRVRAWFSWLEEQGEIERNPWHKVRRTRAEYDPIPPPDPAAVERMIAILVARARTSKSWMDLRNVALVALLFDTGLRAQEALSLAMGDLSRDAITVRGKGNKVRTFAPSANVLGAIRRYVRAYARDKGEPDEADALWQGRQGAITYHTLYEVVRATGVEAGITAWPHLMRHWFAVGFLEEGGSRENVQLLLGHRSSQHTQRYVASTQVARALRDHDEHSPARKLKLT